ncbi:hydrogen gas-evolving membrane-bound hydrogenase subunit E [Helicovermis profundi]|uniref:MrpA C-terminal/MbhE domain-containing protein n=1 Tax=Helicovermis profundi TaxID=3065157 RepID=A0AAU9E200_9FIRM|nr:hypothetical protein HLPR_06740 [Clostridia bacterium S502]
MKKILASIITIAFIIFLLIAVNDMPLLGLGTNPSHNIVMEKYINDAMKDTGAVNIVSAMILDYRAFDTFIETSVIYTALICVFMVLKKGGTKYED